MVSEPQAVDTAGRCPGRERRQETQTTGGDEEDRAEDADEKPDRPVGLVRSRDGDPDDDERDADRETEGGDAVVL